MVVEANGQFETDMKKEVVVYQGPGDKSLVVRSGTRLRKIKVVQVGWSLLRNLTSLEWEPAIRMSMAIKGAEISNCTFLCKGFSPAIDFGVERVQDGWRIIRI